MLSALIYALVWFNQYVSLFIGETDAIHFGFTNQRIEQMLQNVNGTRAEPLTNITFAVDRTALDGATIKASITCECLKYNAKRVTDSLKPVF